MSQSVAPTPHPDLKIISSRVFRGPNIWHYEPAIQLVVASGRGLTTALPDDGRFVAKPYSIEEMTKAVSRAVKHGD